MIIKPAQLFALAAAGFAAIVLSQLLVQYRSNEEFRQKFAAVDSSKLLQFRKRLLKEEGIESPVTASVDTETVDTEAVEEA